MKKNIFLTVILGIASILIIFFGRQYANNQEEEMLQNSLSANNTNETEGSSNSNAEQTAPDTLSTEEKLAEYESNLDSLSILQTIDYTTLTNEQAKLAYYGPIDTSLEWYGQMNTIIQDNVSGPLEIEEYTYPETDTYDLYIQRTVDTVVESGANVIIYRMPALEDKNRDIGLSETNQYLTSIMNALTEGLPDTDIFFMEPAPILSEFDNPNSRSLSYRSYMNEMNSVAAEFGIPVIAIHDQFTTLAEEEGLELDALFDEEQTNLNEQGNTLIQQAIESEVSNTTNE
ncbi:SGNH/GDSL hydrolase family protein [Marinilactibacillus sp. GCM10026970]|uniref:SGNH/GDSL hydrolase family protein n=1 Tax=Marinilactibacillus sp. GCM10026970 TaxID=3252642 RepID=UPI003617BE1E